MILNHLELTAIGPFADTQSIDFERLRVGGLFLFEGPTGSGKSAVLDAISFALYGGLAGDGADKERLHSDFAPETSPRITLEFTTGGRRFRVIRIPEHQRRKKRGTGWTQQSQSATLYAAEGDDWTLLSSNAKEIGDLIENAIGLTRQQFTRVVLLPQGEFAKFLKAADDERRSLLTKLFGAERFDLIIGEFEKRAKAARKARESTLELVKEKLAKAAEAGGDPDGQWHAENADLPAQLEAHAVSLAHDTHLEREAQTTAASEAQKAETAATAAADHSELLRECFAIQIALQNHVATQGDHDHRAAALERAESAARFRAQLDDLAKQEDSVDEANRAAANLAAGLDRHLEACDATALAAEREALTTRAGELSHLRDLEAALPERRRQLADKEGEREKLTSALAANTETLDDLNAQRDKQDAEFQAAAATAGKIPALEAEEKTWSDRHEAAEDVRRLEAREREDRDAAQSAIDAHQNAVDKRQLLLQRRIDGMAGELAASLIDGRACLVCGATVHPAPAQPHSDSVDAEAIEAATREVTSMASRRDERTSVLQAVQTERATALGRMGDLDEAAIEQHLVDVRGKLSAAREASYQRDQLAQTIATTKDRLTALEGQLRADGVRQASLGGELEPLRTSIKDGEAQVSSAAGAHGTIAALIETLTVQAISLGRLAQALHTRENAFEKIEQARLVADESARDSGFTGLADVRSAMIGDDSLSQLREQVRQWVDKRGRLTGQLSAERFHDLAGLEAEQVEQAKSDADNTRSAHAAAQARLTSRTTAAVQAAERQRRFDELRAEVESSVAALATVDEGNGPILELDRLTRGMAGGAHPMNLTSYVLRYWFAQVIKAANIRLASIGGGRYQLTRNEAGRKGERRVGLGLSVQDNNTGQERGPGTLSGGESFYISLALALGLADVVQAEAGGVSLETLFIDEGFGTLDAVTLEDVLNVIDGLRANGRTVGIVSHVEELKERIPERLEVRRTRDDGPSRVRVIA